MTMEVNAMDKLLAELRRQSDAAFVELVAAQENAGPELKRMLAQMARDSRRAYKQLLRDSEPHEVP